MKNMYGTPTIYYREYYTQYDVTNASDATNRSYSGYLFMEAASSDYFNHNDTDELFVSIGLNTAWLPYAHSISQNYTNY